MLLNIILFFLFCYIVYSLDCVLGDMEHLYLLPLSRPRRALKGKKSQLIRLVMWVNLVLD